MVFNRKRKDNRSNSFILDDSPKRTKVQAQRKFAQGSNVNSPVLSPVKELEKSEKVIPEPIELVPMKRPNTEDFLTFLCFRGTPVLPANLSFFNNASMVERNQSSESTSTSPKNGVILPSISKTPGERPFIAFGVRKRADPIVVSRHMDKKRRHALALQALRRKYQEQKMAKIRAITISKLSEKVQTNKTVVRTTRSVTKQGPITKKNIAQKTKITVVATKVTTRRTSTLKQPVRTNNIKPKMCLRSYRGRFVQRELVNKPVKKRPMPKKKVVQKDKDESDEEDEEEEEEEEEEFTSGDDEPLLQKSMEGEKIARKTASVIPKKPTDKGFHKTKSNVITNQKVTRRHPAQTRLLVRAAQSKIKSPPNSPRLRSQQLKRNVKLIQSKKEQVKSPVKKQVEITKKLEIKKNTITNKPLEVRNVKVLTTRSESLKKNISEGITKKKLVTSNETIKGKLRKPANKTNKVNVAENVKKAVKPVKRKVEVTKKQNECDKKPCEETGKNSNAEESKKVTTDENNSKVKEVLSEKKAEVSIAIEKKDPELSDAQNAIIKENQNEVSHTDDTVKIKASTEKLSKETVMNKEKKDENVTLQEVCDILKDTKLDEPKKKIPQENSAKKKSLEQSAKANLLIPEELKKVTKELKIMLDETNLKPVDISKVSTKLLKSKVASNEPEATKALDLDLKKLPQRPSRKTKEAAAIYMEILGHKLVNKDDVDEDSMDSFPELPNVRKTEQRENELKAKAKEDNAKKRKSKSPAESDGDNSSKVRRSSRRTRISKAQSEKMSHDSDESFTAEVTLPAEKQLRPIRNKSPKLYRSFSDTDSETLPLKKTNSSKRKSETLNSESDSSKRNKKKYKRVFKKQSADSFSESDEEPLAKLTQKKSEDLSKKTSVRSKGSQQETATVIVGKQKRECTKRPQNYMPYSSSDEEEKLFLGFDKAASPPKPVEPTLDLLCTKDMGRRYGKERVNMSNEQIEKWLNDSALAGMSLIKKENDEMLKFGEKIPTETNLENSNMSSINTESLKSALLVVPKCNMEKIEKKEDNSLSSTPEKYSTASLTKPLSNERKPIFTKKERHSTDVPPKNINAFSVCNESSVYAFADTEDSSVNTPFRRPSRRPSSTATSKSEDDPDAKFRLPNMIKPLDTKSISKEALFTDESNTSCTEVVETLNPFYIPQQPKKVIPSIKSLSTPMFPPSQTNLQKRDKMPKAKSVDRLSENSEDFKYKVPSSPSASSSSSAKLYKRQNKNKLLKVPANYMPVNTTEFPELTGTAQIVEAPVFHPSEKEFIDPIEYIEKIRSQAEKFGVCRIVPPANFKPECKVLDEMRFTAYNQYVHKMMHRWGPNFKELVAIRKYLATQSISLKHPPWIGGMEIDLPRLYQTVQTLGGLKEVIEKKKWPRVSELMKIPKSARDRVTKLDDIYCKYLLPYDTLSSDERDKLFDTVETEWAKRESKNLLRAQGDEEKSDEEEESEDEDETDIECIVKGRSMALSAFYRIARNTMAMWFKTPESSADEVEEEFWNHVTSKQYHICVHSGSIDSGNWGYGFAVSKNSPFARHAWNLKVLTNNSGSILRSMGPVMGLTVPTLHVGMVFSGCCWYRDPHSLPWIEYCHTGANKIWYGIPDSMSEKFHETLLKLVPNYCLNKSLWLPSDTAMLPPNLLVDNGVSLTRTVQEPGQFVVIFPKAFTSNICTGYVVSESVFFAQPDWLNCARKVFEELRNSCEPSMFSYERLVLSVATDVRSDVSVLRQIIPAVEELCQREIKERQRLKELGVIKEERLPLPDVRKKKKVQNDTETEYACEDCRWNLFCSMVFESQDNAIYCIEHAINHIEDKSLDSTKCKLMYTYDLTELSLLPDKVRATIEAKLQKKAGSKFTGMATLLNR